MELILVYLIKKLNSFRIFWCYKFPKSLVNKFRFLPDHLYVHTSKCVCATVYGKETVSSIRADR